VYDAWEEAENEQVASRSTNGAMAARESDRRARWSRVSKSFQEFADQHLSYCADSGKVKKTEERANRLAKKQYVPMLIRSEEIPNDLDNDVHDYAVRLAQQKFNDYQQNVEVQRRAEAPTQAAQERARALAREQYLPKLIRGETIPNAPDNDVHEMAVKMAQQMFNEYQQNVEVQRQAEEELKNLQLALPRSDTVPCRELAIRHSDTIPCRELAIPCSSRHEIPHELQQACDNPEAVETRKAIEKATSVETDIKELKKEIKQLKKELIDMKQEKKLEEDKNSARSLELGSNIRNHEVTLTYKQEKLKTKKTKSLKKAKTGVKKCLKNEKKAADQLKLRARKAARDDTSSESEDEE